MNEDDLQWLTDEKTIVNIDQLHKKSFKKPLVFRKLNHPSEMRNGALMHRESLKGLKCDFRDMPGTLLSLLSSRAR